MVACERVGPPKTERIDSTLQQLRSYAVDQLNLITKYDLLTMTPYVFVSKMLSLRILSLLDTRGIDLVALSTATNVLGLLPG